MEAPPSGHARVAVGAIGLNFADLAACLGLYSATPQGAFVPGLEFAGTVEAVGEGATTVAPGNRVIGLTRFGAYATHINADARYLHPLPGGWSVADGAAFPVQAITAWYAISELGACKAGDAVLVQSAAGGVGLNALAILRAMGARVVAAVGHDSKVAFLRSITPASSAGRSSCAAAARSGGNWTRSCAPIGSRGSISCWTPSPGRSSIRRTGGCGRPGGW